MPFLHGSWGHLLSNSIPLVILLTLLAGSRANSIVIVVGLIFTGGVLLWLFGRASIHIGASGLVYGLVAFLIASGFLEGRLIPLLIAILVGFLYGATMFWGVLPTAGKNVSWDGHLFGALAGFGLAYSYAGWNTRSETLPIDESGK
jgi:membrane associated rhomboid family serine protease